jgi:hypothetical protein
MSTPPSSKQHSTTPQHPFAHAKGKIVVIPPSAEDFIEDEIRSYDEIVNSSEGAPGPQKNARLASPTPTRRTLSVFSNDIWLGDNSGESRAFARDVKITGWTSVGDKRGGAYIGLFNDVNAAPKCSGIYLQYTTAKSL